MPRASHPARRAAGVAAWRAPLRALRPVAVIAALVAPLMLAAEPPRARQAPSQDAGLLPVAGHWTRVQDEGPALRADGEKWSGETPRTALEASARALFGTPNDSFVANLGATGAFPLAVWRPTADFSGGTVRVHFKMIGGKTDQNAGIVFGLQPTGRYWYVRYNTKDGDVALWEFTNGERRVIAHGETSAQLALNAWHELVLTVSGTSVSGSVNGGALRLDYTLDSPVSGRIGVWTKRDAVTAFRDFRVAP